MLSLPATLIDAVKDQRAVLFLGSGASRDATHPQNTKVPTGDGLRDAICTKYFGGALKDRSLMAVSAMALNEAGFTDFQKYIHDFFEPFGAAEFHKLLPTFRWKALATTNYDLIVERAYSEVDGALQNLVKTVKDGDSFDRRMNEVSNPLPYYKLHGCIDHYTDETIPLILSNEQYASYEKNRKRFYNRFQDLGYEYPVIFVGYSISDQHIQRILFDLTSPEIGRPMYFMVMPGVNDIETRYWAAHRVTCIDATFSDFLEALDNSVPKIARQLPVTLGGGALSVRQHYRVADASESSDFRTFIKDDVIHVYAGMNANGQDAKKFYRGYDEGFGCIVQNLDVRRSFTDSVLVDAILTPEEDEQASKFFLLKGPAGNGKSVSLKRIAWEAAVTYEQLVLFVEGSAGLRIEPFEELHQLTGKRVFLFVDHVALVREDLLKLIRDIRRKSLPVTIVGAERDNEWNIYCEQLEPFLTQDFPVRYLNQQEVANLVSLLARHNALGHLSGLSEQERLDAFNEVAERQLLVALYEATSGLPFEDIVLNEYQRIEPPLARRVYLQICALHQFGAPVRAGLISRASGVSFADFGKSLIRPLENVVLIVRDRHSGDEFYRTRHQQVASMVFNRALPKPEDRFDLLADLISSMNVDYSSDSETFGRVIKGRNIVDIFPNIELGRLFYDQVEEAAPGEAFVPHQRAVFEINHAGGSLVLAEEAAARAFGLNPNSRAIRHTQAEIARRLANETNDPLVKQALRKFTRGKISNDLSRMSEYDLASWARLAVDELRDELSSLSGEDDKEKNPAFMDAAQNAELAIQRGLQMYPESAEIVSIEAQLWDLLEQDERALRLLERAFALNPRQDWLAMRLAKKYFRQRDWSNAIRVLDRCLKDNPSSKIAHLEYARVLINSGGAEASILEHLRKSYTVGDNHFEAQFWHGRELFARGELSDAKKVFDNLHANAPGRFRTGSSAPITDVAGVPVVYFGEIERIEEGYAFIRSTQFKQNLFAARHDSEADIWSKLTRGASIGFNLEFARRGARVVKIRPQN